MGNVVRPIPGFIGGVSQQSPIMRLDTQAEASDNALGTVADGLNKRPNCDFIKLLSALTSSSGHFTHQIMRDQDEKYIVVLCDNATTPLWVFDLDGVSKTVNYVHPDNKAYLTADITDCKTQLKAISIADYTIIANTMKTTAMLATTTAARLDAAHVWFKRRYKGATSVTFHWKESGVNQSYTQSYTDTENGEGTSGLADWYGVNCVHAKLTFTADNNVLTAIPITGAGAPDAGTLYVTATDPYGGEALIPISKGEVEKLDYIPRSMPVAMTLKVGGDRDESQDDYYLLYDVETARWTETHGWGQEYALDPTTMPHQLVRENDGTFTFGPCTWASRGVGDEETAADPSFIGYPINNLRFHKNRLWMFSGGNCVGSKSGEYFNYFRSTVLDVLDDDPIDIAGTGERVVNIRSAKGFDKGLVLISDQEQFVLTAGDQPFTPKSVAIDSTTEIDADADCQPIKLGPDVYFPSPKGSYLSLRQYTIMPDTMVQDAYDVTAHVPTYIPQGSVMLEGCNQLNMIFLHTSAAEEFLYVHQFLWDGNNKVQQAWFRWEFDCDIIGFKVFGTFLYIIFDDATNGPRLEKINLEMIPLTGEPFRYHLDTLHEADSGVYAAPNTTFTLPVNVGVAGAGWAVIDAATSVQLVAAAYTLAGTTLTILATDASAKTYYVGREYEMRHRLSEWYMRDGENRAIITGALQIDALVLAFVNSGSFSVEVTALSRDAMEAEEMSGIKIGESVLGGVTLLSGEKSFRVMADSKGTIIEIVSDDYLPVSIQLGAWIGTHTMEGTLV